VPLSATVADLPPASTVKVADALPAAVGLNASESVQVAFAASAAVHPFVRLNTAADVPDSVAEVTVNDAVPVFLSVTTCAAEVVPTDCDAKVTALGVNV